MNIEFNTVYDEFLNKALARIYIKHFMDKQNKNYKRLSIFVCVLAGLSLILGLATKNYALCLSMPFYCSFCFILIYRVKNKAMSKSFIDSNIVGCPYKVTFGLYNDYFYEKFENNMVVHESSIRYEFIEKVVETPLYFVLKTYRNQLFILPKLDMKVQEFREFSAFCSNRLTSIYTYEG